MAVTARQSAERHRQRAAMTSASLPDAPAHGVGLFLPSAYYVLTKRAGEALISVPPFLAAEAHKVMPQKQAHH